MWLLLSERRDLLRKNRQFYQGRKCRTCVTRASFYACVKKKKKTPAAVPLVATFAGRLLI